MTNAERFKQLFGLYATELWSKSEKDFLSWLNMEYVPDTSVGELISRQAAIDVLHGYFDGMLETDTWSPCDVYGLIEILPSAQPETAKRIVGKSRDGMTLWYQCDMCNEPVDVQDIYCRGCGRRLIDE